MLQKTRIVNELHQKFRYYGRNALHWKRKCILILPEIEKERVWEQKGFGSIHEYASRLAGISRSCVDDALRIIHAVEDKPELMQVIEKFGVNAVRPVATIATSETAQFWAEKAATMSKNTLETYVREVRTQDQSWQNTYPTGEDRHLVNQPLFEAEQLRPSTRLAKLIPMELDLEIAAELEKLKSDGDWSTLMKELLNARKQLLELQKPKPVNTTSRHIPAKIQKYIIQRSKGRCEFPRCNKKYNILHHTQRFALEASHDPDLIVALCAAHERLAHMSLIDHEEQAPECWEIREHTDTTSEKFVVDQIVMKYRKKT